MKTIVTSKLNLVILLVVITVAGCKNYTYYKHGITSPREESPGSLLTFLEARNFTTSNIYLFSDSAGFGQFMRNDSFRGNILGHMIFDREGNLLEKDTSKCQWAGYDLIRNLHPDSVYPSGEGILLSGLLSKISSLGLSHMSTGKDVPDFTLVVTWAKFLGKYNYRLFDLEPAVKENKQAKIRLIWLNMDMQKSWHLHSGQRLRFN